MHIMPGGRAVVGKMVGMEEIAPRFAERAVELLVRGEVAASLSLCLGGTRKYPDYATGYWILGRCYEDLGKPDDAAAQFLRVNQLVPGLKEVGEALRRVSGEESQKGPSTPGKEESSIDFMLRQLQRVKQGRDRLGSSRSPEGARTQSPEATPSQDSRGSDGEVPQRMTVTLAEIYAQQGEYRAAVAAYRLLMQQRPGEAGRFRERLEVLEKLLQGVDKLGEA